MADEIGAWLAEGEAAEADWGGHMLRLAAKGELGSVGDDLVLDLPALAQRHACRTAECAPGLRKPRVRSCCADLDVSISYGEEERIEQRMDAIRPWMAARDPRWSGGQPAWRDGGTLTRPGGRCVFAIPKGEQGLSCGLHQIEDEGGEPRGALKPLPCRLFPLVVVDLGDGRMFLSAVHSRTARQLGHASAKVFPCLRGDADRPMLVQEARTTLGEIFGKRRATWIVKKVEGWATTG
jgi:hypothetical protein